MKVSDLFHSIHDYFTEKRFVIFALSLIFVLFVVVLFFSRGYAGGAESIWHYSYARFAFKFPEFFFNSWAKPVFTLLSSPFALFGLKGIQFFNILVGVAAGLFSFLVAKELKMKQPILAIILCCFTPVFAYNIFSGLTEILFALILIVTSYLFLKDRYLLASLVVSFLPLIKIEGIYLIPIYAIFLTYKKQYKSILLMFTGVVLYSIAGSFVNHDLFWLINQNPHKGEIGVYGTGSFFQFIKRSPGYFGIPNEIFYVTGLAAGITLFLRDKKEFSKEFFLVILPFFTYLLVHSFMWWSGFGNSQGNNRYMAAIVPLMAVMSTRGLTLFSLLFEIIFKKSWVKTAALYIGILSVIHIPFAVQNYPIPLDTYNRMVRQTTNWINQHGLGNEKIFFKDANFPYILGVNPFDDSKCQSKFFDSKKPHESVELGSVLIYDERFFPLDKIEFDSLVQNRHFELQKVFEPDRNFKVYGRDYRIAIFKRIEPDSTILNQNRMVAYGSKDEFKTLVQFDFDRYDSKPDSAFLYFDDKNDTKCLKIDSLKDQFLFKQFDLSTVSFDKPLELYLKIKINLQDTIKAPLLFVVEVDKKDKQIYYNEIKLESKDNNLNFWSNLDYRIKLPEDVSFKGNLKIYLLNRKKGTYLVDDYQVGYCSKR
jgi:hypothetical protein